MNKLELNLFSLEVSNKIYTLKALEYLMLFAFLVVWIVWPLRGTIGARNIALVTGAVSSILWIVIARPKIKVKDFLPIIFLLIVPIWMIGLYMFRPTVPNLQLSDLQGTWTRVLVGIIFAVGLGSVFNIRPQFWRFFIGMLLIWPIVLFLAYLYDIFIAHSGLEFFISIFKSKIACVYFVLWSMLGFFSIIHYSLVTEKQKDWGYFKLEILYALILIIIFIVNLFSLESLNGFLSIFFALMLLGVMFLKSNNFIHAKHKWRAYFHLILIALIIACFTVSFWQFDKLYLGGKLNALYSDISFIVSIDNSNIWVWTDKTYGTVPVNSLTGRNVNISTYLRVTWYLQGLIFLAENPLGLGYMGDPFAYYMSKAFAGSHATKTHSGWLDFALGVGIFGLLSVWISLGMIVRRAWRKMCQKNAHELKTFYVFWCLLPMIFLWQIGELSDREYIEHFFFVTAFFSCLVCSNSVLPEDGKYVL